MSRLPKRFYKSAEVAPAKGGYTVVLDGRGVKTPAGAPLVTPALAVATVVAEEYLAQDDVISPSTMPMTRLLATAIDRVEPMRAGIVAQLATCAESDVLCYRAEEPDDLVARQEAGWQPLLDWAAREFGAGFTVTQGIMPVEQPRQAIYAVRTTIAALSTAELTALSAAVQACRSVVVGLALVSGRIGPDEAFALAEMDESFQIERWGETEEAGARRRRVRDDLRAAAAYLTLARQPGPAEARVSDLWA